MRTKELRNAFSFEIPFQVGGQDKTTRTASCIKGLQNKRQDYGGYKAEQAMMMEALLLPDQNCNLCALLERY